MTITKENLICVQTALSNRCHSREERLDFLSTFFKREITSTKDLTLVESKELLQYLNTGEVKQDNWGRFDAQNKKHRYLLSRLREAQWVRPHPRHGEVADIERLSAFLKSKKSPVQKPLLEMNNAEVEKIIKVFDGVVIHRFKA